MRESKESIVKLTQFSRQKWKEHVECQEKRAQKYCLLQRILVRLNLFGALEAFHSLINDNVILVKLLKEISYFSAFDYFRIISQLKL